MKSAIASYWRITVMFATVLFGIETETSRQHIRNAKILPECKIVSHCDDNQTKFTTHNFTVVNSTTGTVKVLLKGTSEKHLELGIMEANIQCDSKIDAFFSHSIYECEMNNTNAPLNCSYQEIIFKYLVTACYKIKNGFNETITRFFVETNYTQDKLLQDCSYTAEVSLVQERYFHLFITVTPFLMNSVLRLFVHDRACPIAPRDDQFWWRTEIKERQFDNIIIEKNELQNRTVECAMVKKKEAAFYQLHCEIDWKELSCLMIMRERSNSPINERYCIDVVPIELGPLHPPPHVNHECPIATVFMTTGVLFLAVVPLLGIAFFIGIKLYFSKPKKQRKGGKGPGDDIPPPNMKCKVLLLYPQDCGPFMATMKHLQNLLLSYNCFEVYDCFDPKRMEEIASDPQGWIRTKLLQKDMMIILAETDVAVLHQTAIHKKCVINYTSPIPNNNLFIYGLQILLQSIRPQEYSQIFLIRFEDAAQDKEKLKLSNYRRFQIPEHFLSLVSCMTKSKIIAVEETAEATEMQRLNCSIEEFKQFKQSNPNYHESLFRQMKKLV